MAKTLDEIAEDLKASDKKVQLIYAFNGSGKTRLSRKFRYLVSPKDETDLSEEEVTLSSKKILYYNAFTEDLFYWDNDLLQDSLPRLKIQSNSFTSWVLKEQGQDQNIIGNFQSFTDEKLTPKFSEDFSEVTFSFARGNEEESTQIKISKGEESNFIWSVFYTMIEQIVGVLSENESDENYSQQFEQLEYVFIDDPVSSLDENHLIELAVRLATLIKKSSKLKFLISTHNPLFYNVLYNELGLNKKKGSYMLEKLEDGTFELSEKFGDSNKSFSYHLHLIRIIEEAIESNAIERFHFTLLRNLYEKTANFLGYPKWSELLPGDKEAYLNRIIQFSSHRTLSNEEVAEPTGPEKQIVKFLLDNLVSNYGFWQKGGEDD